jgi:hypothetical protein
VPVYWIVNTASRTVEVCYRPMALAGGPATYGDRVTLSEGDVVEVVIHGRPCVQIHIGGLFPPAT